MTQGYSGKNRYKTFFKAGQTVAGKIAKLEGVVGILGTGSIGRRFGDKYSDLDLIVFAHREAVASLSKLVSIGWICYRGMEFDIVVVPYEQAMMARVPSQFWTQLKRWDYQNSQILFDADGHLRSLLEKKLVYPVAEQARLLRLYQIDAHEHLVFYPEIWAARGRLYNIVDTLMRGVQSIVLWIYAKNRVFEPYISKWLFYHLEMGVVPEHVHLEKLTEIYVKPLKTFAAAMKARKRLLDLCDEIGLRWEVYSNAEAHSRAIHNWESVSRETKRLLTW